MLNVSVSSSISSHPGESGPKSPSLGVSSSRSSSPNRSSSYAGADQLPLLLLTRHPEGKSCMP